MPRVRGGTCGRACACGSACVRVLECLGARGGQSHPPSPRASPLRPGRSLAPGAPAPPRPANNSAAAAAPALNRPHGCRGGAAPHSHATPGPGTTSPPRAPPPCAAARHHPPAPPPARGVEQPPAGRHHARGGEVAAGTAPACSVWCLPPHSDWSVLLACVAKNGHVRATTRARVSLVRMTRSRRDSLAARLSYRRLKGQRRVVGEVQGPGSFRLSAAAPLP